MNTRQSFLSLVTMGFLAMTLLSSCGDIEQNLVLNANGSGTLETSFDVGEMMSMMKGGGLPNIPGMPSIPGFRQAPTQNSGKKGKKKRKNTEIRKRYKKNTVKYILVS